MKEIFARVYEKNVWGGDVSRSGKGSDLVHTAVMRDRLVELIRSLNIKSMTDAACGDFNWMKEIINSLSLEQYNGVDIVADMVGKLNQEHGSANIAFYDMDITEEVVPKTDVIFCRDCLVHLSYSSTIKALSNFKASGSKYLLMTTFTGERPFVDIEDGHWRAINFCCEPFNFQTPISLVDEECQQEDGIWRDKSLGLWVLEELRVYD